MGQLLLKASAIYNRKMKSMVIILLAALVAYTSAASVNRCYGCSGQPQPGEHPDSPTNGYSAPRALIRDVNGHRMEAMESPTDHKNDVHQSAKALVREINDHRMEAMESSGDHDKDVHQSAKALVRDVIDHRKEPMETMGTVNKQSGSG